MSVVIPCYRCADTVGRALQSVFAQTALPREVLLVDDASGDGTLDHLNALAHAYQGPVALRVVALNRNGGAGQARNAGWEQASQSWIAFLDADDAWYPHKLATQWQWLQQHPQVDLCGHLSEVRPADQPLPKGATLGAAPDGRFLSLSSMLVSNRLPTRSVMLRRALPHRFAPWRHAEDYYLWLSLLAAGHPVARIDVALACSFRAEFSPGGLSGQWWKHEKGELATLRAVYQQGGLSLLQWGLASGWSLLKYLRRRWIMRSRG